VNGRLLEWLLVVASAGITSAAMFALIAEPLKPLGPLGTSFWIASLIILTTGVLASLVLVDLKRAFLVAPVSALLAAALYGGVLMSPAVELDPYRYHLLNYSLVQSVPVVVITLALLALGVMAGTVINTSVREYDL
jgi:hypothetical protein